MKFLPLFLIGILFAGCGTSPEPVSPKSDTSVASRTLVVQSARGKHQKNASSTVAVFQSVDGVVVIPDSLFTEPYLFVRNCTGATTYDASSYFRASQGSLIENIPSDPSCTGAGIGSFQPINGQIVIVKPLNFLNKSGPYDTSAVFSVTVVDEPDYALSYIALPRILLVISQ